MKVSTEIMIDGKVVDQYDDFLGYKVYIHSGPYGAENTVYYVKDDVVHGIQQIDCEMGQGIGYVSDLTFENVEENNSGQDLQP